jgi:hypothetical protein
VESYKYNAKGVGNMTKPKTGKAIMTDVKILEKWGTIPDENCLAPHNQKAMLLSLTKYARQQGIAQGKCNGCICKSMAERAVADRDIYSQGVEKGRAETTENPNFKKLKFFKKSVDVEEISLDRIGWTENRRDGGRGYVRAYLSRNYGIKLTPQAISDEVDMAIIYMLYDTATIVNDNIIEREKQAYEKGKADGKKEVLLNEKVYLKRINQVEQILKYQHNEMEKKYLEGRKDGVADFKARLMSKELIEKMCEIWYVDIYYKNHKEDIFKKGRRDGMKCFIEKALAEATKEGGGK